METRMKICGLTTLEDAEAAVEAGAWALGVILWPGSKRACSPEVASSISAAFRRRAHVCGVFVNAPLDEVARTVDVLGLTMVQLHGDEGPTFATEVKRRTGVDVIKAVGVRDRQDIQRIAAFKTDFHLLDSRVEGMVGGTGTTWDHDLLKHRISRVPIILSGGLTPENVGAAIDEVRPFAVDVASGVESAPGIKDHAKIAAFAQAVATRTETPAA